MSFLFLLRSMLNMNNNTLLAFEREPMILFIFYLHEVLLHINVLVKGKLIDFPMNNISLTTKNFFSNFHEMNNGMIDIEKNERIF